MNKSWEKLESWKKGAITGFFFGFFFVPITIKFYKHNIILEAIRDFYLEYYIIFPYGFGGLAQVIELFGKDSFIANIVLYFYYGIPTMIIGIIIGFLYSFYKVHGKKVRNFKFSASTLTFLSFLMLIIVIGSSPVFSYKIDPGEEVHQKITKESEEVWDDIPDEIKEHLESDIHTGTRSITPSYDDIIYNAGDDIIVGSAEEDVIPNFFRHFWQPDDPDDGEYDDGLSIFPSSYNRARDFWLAYVIPLYIEGDKEQSYYWLGKVAHLLEDAAVPAHVHKDNHLPIGDNEDFLEIYTAEEINNLNGNNAGEIYEYEDLPNMGSFDWNDVDSNHEEIKDLFRLFWYTAQKTQYFASNDREGNDTYVKVSGGAPIQFSPSLWTGDGVTIVSNSSEVESSVDDISDAVVPHAMRATAGLYRLFWDSIHIDWPFFHHDLHRTGFTHLEGDLEKNNIQDINITLDSNDDYISRVSIADLDGNGLQEAVVATFNQAQGGYVYSVEKDENDETQLKWSYNTGHTLGSPAISDIIDDSKKEIVYSTTNGKLWRLKVSSSGDSVTRSSLYLLPQRQDPDTGSYHRGNIRNTAIADLDNDGYKEIIFADFLEYYTEDWPGRLRVLNRYGSLRDYVTFGNGGANGAVSIADVDNDGDKEIIVPSTYGVYVYDYDYSDLSLLWSNSDGAITGSVVVYDYDDDGDLELIYVTTNSSNICDSTKSSSCENKIYIRNAETGSLENSISLGSLDTLITPTIANLDGDSNTEIVIVAKNSESTSSGSIRAYDATTDNLEWTYTDGGNLEVSSISPDIVNIDGDSDLDIVYAENNDNYVHIIEEDGALWKKYSFSGVIGSSLAIGDIDGDRKAEIAVKHAGSPITILSYLTHENNAPKISTINNISYNEGESIDLSNLVNASDFNNDTLTISYEKPFNSSGQWDISCKTSGQHLFFVEASDGNLSDIKPVNIEINATCPVIDFIDLVTAIEMEELIITVSATDPNNNTLTYWINDTRFTQNNNIFTWQTQEGHAGDYTFLVNASDGTHIDSIEVEARVFPMGTQLLNVFEDGSTTQLLDFNSADEIINVSIKLPKNSDINYTTLRMEGLSP